MTENRITELFGINPASSVPLRTQLERKLEYFINSSAPGTVIPSERVMAKCLGISRVTVRNAITPFLAAGSIVRHNRSGTAVAPKKVSDDINVNELAIGLPWHLQPVTTLKFLCYETLNTQREFWESVVDDFNAENSNCEIETVWLDKVMKGHAMLNFIAENEIDIMLNSTMYELPLESLAMELPADLQETAENADYVFKDMIISDKSQFRYVFPFQIVYSRIFYNNDLAEKCGLKNVNERLFNNDKIGLMLEALPQLGKNKMASSHIWCHLAYQGIVPDEENMELLTGVLDRMCEVRDFENAFMLKQAYSLDDAAKFVNGEMLFFDGASPQLQALGTPVFELKQQIAGQLDGTFKFGTPVGICIAGQCRNSEFAAEFIRFLASNKVQKEIADTKNEFPVKKEFFKYAAAKQCELSCEYTEKLLKKTFLFQNSSSAQEKAMYFCIFKTRDLLEKMMKNKISSAECAAGILRSWKNFRGRKKI
ncbi:MAG: GntR family transcriptional regulator [Lentisphaeria bacterium]|nr:GntR family transcriptional regulator [Lentisphaeria bacterium]